MKLCGISTLIAAASLAMAGSVQANNYGIGGNKSGNNGGGSGNSNNNGGGRSKSKPTPAHTPGNPCRIGLEQGLGQGNGPDNNPGSEKRSSKARAKFDDLPSSCDNSNEITIELPNGVHVCNSAWRTHVCSPTW